MEDCEERLKYEVTLGVRVEEGLRGSEIWVTVSQWEFPGRQGSGLEVSYEQKRNGVSSGKLI